MVAEKLAIFHVFKDKQSLIWITYVCWQGRESLAAKNLYDLIVRGIPFFENSTKLAQSFVTSSLKHLRLVKSFKRDFNLPHCNNFRTSRLQGNCCSPSPKETSWSHSAITMRLSLASCVRDILLGQTNCILLLPRHSKSSSVGCVKIILHKSTN